MIHLIFTGRQSALAVTLLSAAVASWLCGCGPTLMPTPTIYQSETLNPFSAKLKASGSTDANIFFVTDRQFDPTTALKFNNRRDYNLNFGACQVQFGHSLSWNRITTQLQSSIQSNIPLRISSVRHIAALPDPLQFNPTERVVPTTTSTVPDVFMRAVREQLQDDATIYLYIHGYNTSFEKATTRMAGLWHWLGRRGAAIVYSWPSDNSFLGYLKDRETARFTVAHFKAFLVNFADKLPTDTKVNIIAHSTGVGVVIDALREINLASTESPEHVGRQLKLDNIIVAAADLDTDVMLTRAIMENVHRIAKSTTIYVSSDDLAIRLSNFFYFGITGAGLFSQSPFKFPRLGGLQLDRLSDSQMSVINRWLPNVDMIDVSRASVGWIRHSYFAGSPAVSSDIVLRLRYGLDPVKDAKFRPLERISPCGRLWRMERDYLEDLPKGMKARLQQKRD